MAKWCGNIGFAELVETRPGVWQEQIIEHFYSGDELKNTRNLETSNYLNDDINIVNKISIVADPYAYQNFHSMRYVEFRGSRWKVKTVEVVHPRLVLTVGGVYNG